MGRRRLTVERPEPGVEVFTFDGTPLGRVERVELPTRGVYLWRARLPDGRLFTHSVRSVALSTLVELAEEA